MFRYFLLGGRGKGSPRPKGWGVSVFIENPRRGGGVLPGEGAGGGGRRGGTVSAVNFGGGGGVANFFFFFGAEVPTNEGNFNSELRFPEIL